MELLSDWSKEDFNTLEKGVIIARHRLLESGLFSDEALIKMLDNHPDSAITLATMGQDSKTFEWRDGDRNGVSGEKLLECVKNGHLWINCREMVEHHPEYAKLINQLYDELQKGNSGFVAQDRTANLLISSPSAIVHYHVDMPVNMLWHLRGRKRVWVYPPYDHRFASMNVLEHVCAGEWSEDIPYYPDLDRYAIVHDAAPGELITWPQLTPHRVTNLEGLNVSLSTEHKNPRARRRLNVIQANHFFRNRLKWAGSNDAADGPLAHVKQFVARSVRLTEKVLSREKEQVTYPKSFIVDPDAPGGFQLLKDGKVVAPHQTQPA